MSGQPTSDWLFPLTANQKRGSLTRFLTLTTIHKFLPTAEEQSLIHGNNSGEGKKNQGGLNVKMSSQTRGQELLGYLICIKSSFLRFNRKLINSFQKIISLTISSTQLNEIYEYMPLSYCFKNYIFLQDFKTINLQIFLKNLNYIFIQNFESIIL